MTELERQQAAYKAARARLYNPKPPPAKAVPPAAVVQEKRVLYNFVPKALSNEDVALSKMGPAIVRQILWETFFFTGVTPAEILGGRRQVRIARARQHAMARVYAETQMSMPAVGRAFNRDHTTILHALRKTDWYVASPQPKAAAFIGPKRPKRPLQPPSKLTPDIVIALRQSFDAGERTIRSMALELGISRSTLHNMLRRKTWKHVS